MKTYIINLPHNIERKGHAIKELQNHPEFEIEFISAIYGANLNDNEISSLVDTENKNSHFNNNINKAEIGCALSHIKCYKQFLKSQEELALILEDDILISKDINTILPLLSKIIQTHIPSIILLTPNVDYKNEKQLNTKYNIGEVISGFTALGYIINRAAAQILIKNLEPVHSVADNWGYFRKFGIKIYNIIPHPISWMSRNEIDSTITSIKTTNQPTEIIQSNYILKIKLIIKNLILNIKRSKKSNRIWWNSNRIEKGF